MSYKYNGKKVSKKKLLEKIDDPNTVIQEVSIQLPNKKKVNKKPTMEGFDIPKDLLIDMALQSDKLNGSITATFEKCGKLGGKTVKITVE
jgi:hypothetical protein